MQENFRSRGARARSGNRGGRGGSSKGKIKKAPRLSEAERARRLAAYKEQKRKQASAEERGKAEREEQAKKNWGTIGVIIVAPIIWWCIIWQRSYLVKMLTRLSGKEKKEKEKELEKVYPTNQTKLPYAKPGSKVDPRKDPKNTNDFTTYIKDPKKAAAEAALKSMGLSPTVASAVAAAAGGGRKRKKKRKQRGGNNSDIERVDDGSFMSMGYYGFPYDLKDSEYTFLQGLGEYFISFTSKNREFEQKYMMLASDILYKSKREVPGKDAEKSTRILWEITDFSKLTFGLGFTEIIKLICFIPYNIYLVFYCAFQAGPNPLMWIACLIFGILTVIGFGFYPFQFYILLGLSSVLSNDKGKNEFMKEIMRMYKFVWMALLWITYGIAIPSVQGWTLPNEEPNWFWIICSWVFPPVIFGLDYLGLLPVNLNLFD